MNIESLEYFYKIAKEGSISSVAKDVHLSQSALSQKIQKLEDGLGKQCLSEATKVYRLQNMERSSINSPIILFVRMIK